MDPSFEVDAQYFYALGAQWPIGVAAGDRFTLATAPSETKLAAQLQTAMDTGVIGQNPGGNSPLQAARRLVALGAARASTQLGDERTYTVRPTVDVHNDLVTVTNGLVTGVPNATALQFSIIEALYARGFTSIDSIIALDQADFSQALTGSVAFQWAGEIWKKGFFYDVIPRERPLGPLSTECAAECWVEFPATVGEICSAYVIASYDTECWPRCGLPRHGECCEHDEREELGDQR
jgi:hypothetical protein